MPKPLSRREQAERVAEVRRDWWRALQEGREAPSVIDVFRRPSWHARAACRGKGVELFFPTRGQPAEPARLLCAACVVQRQCREFAADNPRVGAGVALSGIWGGQSARERRRERLVP